MDEERFRRSRTSALVFLAMSAAALGFLIWVAWPTQPLQPIGHAPVSLGLELSWKVVVLGLLWIGMAFMSVRQLRRARHAIVVDGKGIHDPSVTAEPIAWTEIRDVSLVPEDNEMFSVKLELARGRQLEIDLWGVATPADAVFSAIAKRWQRARDADSSEATAQDAVRPPPLPPEG